MRLRPQDPHGPRTLAEAFGRKSAWKQQQELAVYGMLGDLGAQAGPYVPFLLERFDASGVYLRWKIAEQLGRIGPPARSALPRLVRAFRAAEVETGRQAFRDAIARIDPAAAEALD